MNKTTFRIAFIIISLLGLITGHCIVKAMYRPSDNCIIKTTTDERGLTSIQYRQNGQEWGADYLTPQELDSLQSVLNGN